MTVSPHSVTRSHKMEIRKFLPWDEFKAKVSEAKPMYYDESDDRFIKLYIIAGPVVFEHEIFKTGFFPIVCYQTQEQNDANKANFEASYKSAAIKVG